MKKCSKCTIEKPTEQFSRHKNSKDGRQSYCKECSSIEFNKFRVNRLQEGIILHVDSKVCIKCRLEKPRSQFGKRSVSKDGLADYCKSCWRCYIYGRKSTAKI
jgi:hypothetical protein